MPGPERRGQARALLELAVLAERLGFHSLWLPEARLRRGATPSPLVVLAAVAARTERLRIGTVSLLLSLRDPLHVASEVATLDQLSGGRLLLGVGRGYDPRLFRALGVDPRTKRARLETALRVLKEAWAAAPPVRDCAPTRPARRPRVLPPLQRPHPPILVAAFGRRGLLQAARLALPYLASPLEPFERLEENYTLHREALTAPLERFPRVPVMRTVHVAASRAEAEAVAAALRREAELWARRAPPGLARVAAAPLERRALVGSAAEVRAGIDTYRERLGMDLLIVRPVPELGSPELTPALVRLAEALGDL